MTKPILTVFLIFVQTVLLTCCTELYSQQITLDSLTQNTVRPHWEDMPLDQWRLLLDEQKQQLLGYQKQFPRLKAYETPYFLFMSDAPGPIYKDIVSTLDNMYALLCKSFGIEQIAASELPTAEDPEPSADKPSAGKNAADKPSTGTAAKSRKPVRNLKKKVWKNIWRAKCMIVVFMDENDFVRFETQVYRNPRVTNQSAGYCHQTSRGDILISVKAQKDPANFYSTLVHETTHGFVWLHRAPVSLPTWLSEGIADWSAMTTVPKSTNGLNKQRAGVMRIKQTGSLNGLLFAQDIDAWQYGISSLMINMLIMNNNKGFISLINDIKDGKDVSESFNNYYKVTPEQFVPIFGRKYGVPNLRP